MALNPQVKEVSCPGSALCIAAGTRHVHFDRPLANGCGTIVYDIVKPIDNTAAEEHLRRAASLDAEAAKARARAAYLESLPQDVYDEGTVVVFTHTFPQGGTYSYGAVKCRDSWYTTGPRGGNEARTWQNLCQFADEGSLYWCPTAEPVV